MPVAAARWISAITFGLKVAEKRGGVRCGGTDIVMASIGVDIVDVEVIEAPRRAIELEVIGARLDAGPLQHGREDRAVFLRHRLLDAVGAQAGDAATHEQSGLIDRIAE